MRSFLFCIKKVDDSLSFCFLKREMKYISLITKERRDLFNVELQITRNMLDSLEVKNYRNLKHLKINSLGQINLITGKNNTGKSTILEAISLYASKGSINLMYSLLEDRGENFRSVGENKSPTELNVKSLSSLFFNRFVGFETDHAISIGPIQETREVYGYSVAIRFVKYFDEMQRDDQGLTIRKRIFFKNGVVGEPYPDFEYGMEVRSGNEHGVFPLKADRLNRFYREGFTNDGNFQFIKTRNIDSLVNGKLWDNITLTEKEQFVIDALRIIEPSTERIAFIGENSRERIAVIKLSGTNNVLPLRSMGDGINRILTIILALINSDNGFLLIDEFENGLHHTVQEQLWNIIFQLSQKLNVQVFVTTHSEDCIRSFEDVLNGPHNPITGKLIRLDNIDGVIKQVEFNAKELEIATNQDIETR